MFSRRELIRAVGRAAVATTLAPVQAAIGDNAAMQPATRSPARRTLCLFSKHLPHLGWRDLGSAVKDAGFDGVDLTVRPKGHVLPERAVDDLPRAIEAIRASGVAIPMITTDLTSASVPHARGLLKAAVASGVEYFKPGYWLYTSASDVRAQVAAAGEALARLAALAEECGIQMGFHNHAGYIGAALWEIAPAIDRLNARWAGYYFDPRHAVAEGGGGAWKAATHLVLPRLKMIALKDFFWEKAEKGWRTKDCPLGDGQVDWAWFGATLRDANFQGPVSLHLEYEIPGASPREQTRATLDAAKRDLAFARRIFDGGV